ncbi:hypothetical protein ES703_32613 [subsurface metagenome]
MGLATAAALLVGLERIPIARADDTAACVAKMSEFVAELDQLLSKEKPWFGPGEKSGTYEKLLRRHFPLDDCDGDPLLIEASKSRFFRDIGYSPRPKYYVAEFSNTIARVGFVYHEKERRAESNGVHWVDK